MTTQTPEEIVQPLRSELELAAVLHALSDPVRLQMVTALADQGGAVACSNIDVPVTKSTCTHHFKVLREAGLIAQEKSGRSILNTLRRDDLDARFPGLLNSVLASATR